MRRPWLFLALDLGCIPCTSSFYSPGQAMVVPTESDAPSYFRVRVPSSAPALKISVEADRPVAFFAALGYFPKESHYDISNFPAWALGALYSDIHIPLNALRESPCEGSPGALESCLVRATTTEDTLRCGKAPLVDDAAVNASAHAKLPTLATVDEILNPNSDLQHSCVKDVDTCTDGICRSRRGPTLCTIDLQHAGEGQCLCQQGFCAVSGRCINADSSQATCMKITGTVCPYYACDDSLGPTNCEDGLCTCAPGHCSIGGVCHPGEMCREVGMRGMCDSVASEKRHLSDLKSTPSAAADPCCDVINGARYREPGRFARCAARHFFSLDHAHARGIHFPLLADLSEEGDPVDELVVAVRTSATMMRAPNAIGDARQGEVEVRLKLLQDADADVRTVGDNNTSPKLSPLYHFRTYQELVAPPLTAFGGLPPMVLQIEAPLLLPEMYAFNPALEADKPVDHVPDQGVRFRLHRQELLAIRLGENSLLEHGKNGGLGGVLQLHIVDLPPGSRVLYSHAQPEPRSLMAFGHAQLVDSRESVSGRPSAGIWRAPIAERSARFFAILPAADAHAAAFFAVQNFAGPGGDAAISMSGAPPPLPTVLPVTDEDSHNEDLTGAAAARAVTRTLCLGAALSLAGAAAWAWCWRFYDQNASGGLRDKQRPYMAVSGTDVELYATTNAAVDASSDDDAAAGRNLGVAARAKISSLRVFGEAVKEKLGQTGALLSASTRAGTSRFSASSRRSIIDEVDGRADLFQDANSPDRCPHTAEEAQGLLNASYIDDEDEEEVLVSPAPGSSRSPPRSPESRAHAGKSRQMSERSPSGIDSGSKDDLEALSALMKLRPAARDSVGDDADDEELSGRPLIGTGRQHSLSR